MRRAIEHPSIDFFLEKHPQRDVILLVLMGHLSVEYLLVSLIQLKQVSNESPWNLNFPSKVDQCIDLGFITQEQGNTLNALNSLRNNFSHVLGHKLSFDDVFKLAQKAGKAGFDFSDDAVWMSRELSEEWYGIEGVVNEIVKNIYLDLSFILVENGGDDYSC